jgi:hypothetical protein
MSKWTILSNHKAIDQLAIIYRSGFVRSCSYILANVASIAFSMTSPIGLLHHCILHGAQGVILLVLGHEKKCTSTSA